jgi:DtxR family Mn-dependent transcriptional regulator
MGVMNKMNDIDYKVIKYLYKINKKVKVGELASEFSIPHSTMGSCIKRLRSKKLLDYDPYGVIQLTDSGKELASELIRHAQLVEVFLHRELNLSAAEANRESEVLHLQLSCETINRICQKYDHPKKCPCGEEIVNSKACHCDEA